MRLKNSILTISLLIFCILGLAQTPNIQVQIAQGKSIVNVLEVDSIVLQRKKFIYAVQFPTGGHIRLHHSYSDSLFNLFKKGKINFIKDWSAFSMAEEAYNTDKELLLNTDGWSYWFYEEQEAYHRFDAKSIRQKNNIISGKKTVRNIFDVDSKTTISVKKINKPIYAIIALNKDNSDNVAYSHCFKIIFKD